MFQIIENKFLVKTIYRYENRSWKARLLERPWNPLEKYRLVSWEVPSDEFLIFRDTRTIVIHPSMRLRVNHMLREVGIKTPPHPLDWQPEWGQYRFEDPHHLKGM